MSIIYFPLLLNKYVYPYTQYILYIYPAAAESLDNFIVRCLAKKA